MKNKIVALGLAITTLVWAAPMMTSAATTDELQAQINALLQQIAALQAQLQIGGTASACFTKTLKFGMSDSEVTALQTSLKGDATVYPEGLVTGYFGSLTQKAVKAFQTKYGIDPVGQVGPITRAKLNSLYCVAASPTPTPTPTATPVAGPLTVTLASDNPPAANVQQGSANNVVAKFTFTAGSTAVNVTGLIFKSYGTVVATGNADITALKLFDENGIQLGTDRIQAGNQVNFVIVPALAIPANSSRTVALAANIATNATSQVMATVRYGLESATAITGATFSGTYPVVGNSFMIVPAGQLGSVSVSKFGSVPKTNVKIGEKDIVVERFNVAAGSNEDVLVSQIVLSSNAASTIADSDIANIRIRKVSDGTVVAGPLTLSNKKATFNLTTPISLTKGASINLEAVADIASGATLAGGRTIKLEIALGGVVARGATSGTNIVSTGNTVGTSILIGIGTLTVSMSANHPQGANALLITTTNKKTIAAFSVRANGEDIILNQIDFNFLDGAQDLDAANYLSAVGVYDGDSLISDLKTIAAPNNEAAFSLNYTIPANTTKELLVKAVTNTMTGVNNDQLTTTWSYYLGYGLSSGETITSGANYPTTAITISASGKATLAAETTKTPYSQGVLAPINNVILGALKVYAQREDLKLTKLVLTAVGTGYVADDISSVTLYADDGVTLLSNPVSEGAGNTFTITSDTDLISDIVFTKAVYKTILVKANVNVAIAGVPNLHFTIANADDNLTFEGMDSAQPYDYNDDTAGWDFAFNSPYAGGTFAFSQTLVEMKKASTSPSGSVSRGSSQTYAIWDLTNVSSDTYDAKITSIMFTSKTGLPSGAVVADYKLYDGDGNKICDSVVCAGQAISVADGTITFANAGAVLLTIPQGTPKQLVLEIDTTSTTKYPSSTQMQWTLNAFGDATVLGGVAGATTGYIGYGGTTYSIPATANVVTLP